MNDRIVLLDGVRDEVEAAAASAFLANCNLPLSLLIERIVDAVFAELGITVRSAPPPYVTAVEQAERIGAIPGFHTTRLSNPPLPDPASGDAENWAAFLGREPDAED